MSHYSAAQAADRLGERKKAESYFAKLAAEVDESRIASRQQ